MSANCCFLDGVTAAILAIVSEFEIATWVILPANLVIIISAQLKYLVCF